MLKRMLSSLFARGLLFPGIIAMIHFLLHILTNGNYGIFRDEFYYIDCSKHLAWGYVDHPPLSVFLLAVSRFVFGESVHAIRIFPALTGFVLILLSSIIAREFGGKRYAQILTALSVAIIPSYLVMTGFFSMNAFDLLFWTISIYLVIRIIKTGNEKLWLVFGLMIGLGLLNKLSMLFFVMGLVAGLLFTRHRSYLLNKYLWFSGLIAIVIFTPHLLWQINHNWPTLEFIHNAKQYKIMDHTPITFLFGQVVEIHPFNLPIWISGLFFLLFAKQVRSFRLFAVVFIAVCLFFIVQKSKIYYLAPAYPVLLAAGACFIENLVEKKHLIPVKFLIPAFVVTGGLLLLPIGVPVLSADNFLAYQKAIGLEIPSDEKNSQATLPQHFADRFGWENMVATVAEVYNTLPLDMKVQCAIFAGNYGEAGAINYYGAHYGLPTAISGHNNYYLWGPGNASGEVIIRIGGSFEDLEKDFESVTEAAVFNSPYAMPYEKNVTIFVCYGLKYPVSEAWKKIKNYI